MTLGLFGYELTASTEALAILAILTLEAVVLYAAYTRLIELAIRVSNPSDVEERERS